jgi:hypothetical protein
MPRAGPEPTIEPAPRAVDGLVVPSRRLHLYGVGMGKTGTHSLATVFERDYRAAHEAGSQELMELLFDVWDGLRPTSEIRPALLGRDAALRLDMDASLVNGEVVSDLVDLFPDARFVLTVREPRQWLDSMANHTLAHDTPAHWVRWRDIRFRAAELVHPPEEEAWAASGLYTLDGYLGSWARHNRMVLDAVPPDRLLVVRTEDLELRLPDLADFAGVPLESLDVDRVHAFPAAGRYGALGSLDEDHLADRIEHHTAKVMERLRSAGL